MKDAQIYDLDVTCDESHVICCGASLKQQGKNYSEAIVTAVKFDKTLKIRDEVILSQYKVQAATSMKRVPDSDHFILGCFKSMIILYFDGNKFEFVNIIEDIHSSNFSF